MPIYALFEHIIKELSRKHKYMFKENLMFLQKFLTGLTKTCIMVEENLDSRNIKSKFHCNTCSEVMGMEFFGNKLITIISVIQHILERCMIADIFKMCSFWKGDSFLKCCITACCLY